MRRILINGRGLQEMGDSEGGKEDRQRRGGHMMVSTSNKATLRRKGIKFAKMRLQALGKRRH